MQANELATDHINFAASLCYKYIKNKPSLAIIHDDLLSCAYMGLMIAAKKYDENRDIKFTTFANKFIKGQMITFLRDRGFIKRKTIEKINLFKKAEEESLKKFDRVDLKYIKKISNLSIENINLAMQCKSLITLDDPECNVDLPCKCKNPEEAYMEAENKKMLFKLAEQLPQRTREIFKMVCNRTTMGEIGGKFGISESRVSQIYKEAELKIIQLSKIQKPKQKYQSHLPPSQEQPKKSSIAPQTNLIDATCRDCGDSFQAKKTSKHPTLCKKCFGIRVFNGHKKNRKTKTIDRVTPVKQQSLKQPIKENSKKIIKPKKLDILHNELDKLDQTLRNKEDKKINEVDCIDITIGESQRDKKLFDDLERIAKKERRTLCNQILHILDKYVHDRQFA